jgi:hypothetical protein
MSGWTVYDGKAWVTQANVQVQEVSISGPTTRAWNCYVSSLRESSSYITLLCFFQAQAPAAESVSIKSSTSTEPNTASKIRGLFIGIPGKRAKKTAARGDMGLDELVVDHAFVQRLWWNSEHLPEITNSDRTIFGNVTVRRGGIANVSCCCMLPA